MRVRILLIDSFIEVNNFLLYIIITLTLQFLRQLSKVDSFQTEHLRININFKRVEEI